MNAPSNSRPVRLFISYAEKDIVLVEQLKTHLSMLRRQRVVELWDERPLAANQSYEGGPIDPNLDKADIVILLVTPSFMASDYCYAGEMTRAMELHKQGEIRVVPVIGRPTDMTGAPFSMLQGLPSGGKAISKWGDADEAWLNVVTGLRQVVQVMKDRPPRSAAAPVQSQALPTETETAMRADAPDRIRLYEQLAKLMPVQFVKVVLYSRVPTADLLPRTATQAERAAELVEYFERNKGLQALESAIQQALAS